MDSTLLKGLFQNANLGIIVSDTSGSIIQINPFMERITGYMQEELSGKGFYQYCFKQSEVQQKMEAKILSALDKEYDDMDLFIVDKNDKEIAVHFLGYSFTEKGEQFVVTLVENVTNRKAYEKVLESSFDKFIQTTLDLDASMKKIKHQRKILKDYQQKMIRELGIAKGVQRAIIPREFPIHKEYSFYGLSVPSEELGGDYFDFFPLKNGEMGILVADVSGHGVPSSLITTMVKAYFEYYTKEHNDPAKVLTLINKDLSHILNDTGFFLTVIYGVMSQTGRDIKLALAGHDNALVIDKEGKSSYLGDEAKGAVLGVIPDGEYSSHSYNLDEIKKIIFFTDGFTEARNSSGDFFGMERMEEYIKKTVSDDPKTTCLGLINRVNSFYDEVKPNDDRTMVCININND